MRYWHDLTSGQLFKTGSIRLNRQDILKFAEKFDPQPYHLDNNAAEESIFGGLCASGWQVCALAMRLLADVFKDNEIALMGIQEVSSLRWKIPVFAEDSLTSTIEITKCQPESGRAGMGCVTCNIEVHNQKEQTVVVLCSTLLVAHAETGNMNSESTNGK